MCDLPMHALILCPFDAECIDLLRKSMQVTHESWTDTRRLHHPIELAERINEESITALVVESDFVFEDTLDLTPGLRFVGVCRAAVNQVDVDFATANGVVVVNTPGRNANAVAEHTLGLMLALARRIPAAHRYVQSGEWLVPTEPYIAFRGVELRGRTVGIVGLGAVGRRLADVCLALGMNVQAYDPYLASAPDGVMLVSQETLMATSDFVCVHVPLNDETDGMLNAEMLGLMRPHAYLVSASDAAVFDQEALVAALRERRIAGAALDVFESHPVSPQNPLLAMDNVILSPHIGGATSETIQRHSQMMTDDILRFARGEKPVNLVNRDVRARR